MTKQPKSVRRTVAPAVQERPTLIEFLLDETGSMASCKAATISGYNLYLDAQRSATGRCMLTLTKFDTTGLKTPFVDLDIGMVPNLTDATFLPGSMTNLHDAIGARVAAIASRISDWPVTPHVLFVVITDGGENGSCRYGEADIRHMVGDHTEQGWTFVFLGPKGSSGAAKRLGFLEGNTREYDTHEMRETMSTIAKATVAYRATRSASIAAEQTFFK